MLKQMLDKEFARYGLKRLIRAFIAVVTILMILVVVLMTLKGFTIGYVLLAALPFVLIKIVLVLALILS